MMVKDYFQDQFLSTRHPYGVKSESNLLLYRNADPNQCLTIQNVLGNKSMGLLRLLDDPAVLMALTYLDALSLCTLSLVSRAMYVFSHTISLWYAF